MLNFLSNSLKLTGNGGTVKVLIEVPYHQAVKEEKVNEDSKQNLRKAILREETSKNLVGDNHSANSV